MRKNLTCFFLFFVYFTSAFSQTEVVKISQEMFYPHQRIFLAPLEGWVFKQGNNPAWAYPDFDDSNWKDFNPTQLSPELEDASGRNEGWFRIKFQLDESFENIPLAISRELWAATDVYLDGKLIHSFGKTGLPYKAYNPVLKYPIPVDLEVGHEYLLAIHFVDYESTFTQREIRLKPENLQTFINLTGPEYSAWVTRAYKQTHIYVTLSIGVSFLLFFLYWFLVYLNPNQTIFRIVAWYTTAVLIGSVVFFGNTFFEISYSLEKVRFLVFITFQAVMTLFGLFILEWVLTQKISKYSWGLLAILLILNIPAHIFSVSQPFAIAFVAMLWHFGRTLFAHRKEITGAKWAIVGAVVVPTVAIIVQIILHKYSLDLYNEYDKLLLSLHILSPPLFYLAYISVRFKETLEAVREESEKTLRITEEKREILANQNILLEAKVNERTKDLNLSLENLKSTQAQLIQSEKMASLGELTAGIAHEIQNPLNFVNNFSEVSSEMIEELDEEIEKGDKVEAKAISADIKQNLEKISLHGKRADAIVKGMLEHSKRGSGEKEPTNLNALTEEFLSMSYQSFLAKEPEFTCELKTKLDPDIPKISVIPQDIGKVLLNLFNNAFYALNEKAKSSADNDSYKGYQPEVTVKTTVARSTSGDLGIEISVKDNGNGIPEHIREKIFQPFFTTKPTGSGTGLGLSLSYDIVKAHGGELLAESEEGKGTKLIIQLPNL